VRGTVRHALQGLGNHGIDARVVDGARRSGPRRVQQAIKPVLDEASSPLADRLLADSLARRHCLVLGTRSAAQNNARTQRHRLRCLAPQRQCLELRSFRWAQHELRLGSSAHRSLAVCTRYTTDSKATY